MNSISLNADLAAVSRLVIEGAMLVYTFAFLTFVFHLSQLASTKKKVRAGGQAFRIFSPVRAKDHEGNVYSLNKGFLDEYLTYPFSAKKDLIDAVSRLYDMEPVPPVLIDESALEPETFVD